jgi:sarcosine oxidase subunit beta
MTAASDSPVRVGIVGGGAVGLACAWHVLRLGGSATVLERSWISAGSSGLSAGVYTTAYDDRLEVELRVRAREQLFELERQGRLHLGRIGYLRLARDAESLADYERAAALQRQLGSPDAEVLDPAGVARVIPDLDISQITGGLWAPGDGYLDGPELCGVYQADIEARGGRVLQRAPLTGMEHDGEDLLLRTPELELRCDFVVNAAGAWADGVGEMLGTPVRQTTERHQVCIAKYGKPLGYKMPTVMDYRVGDADSGLYFRQEGDEQLIAGLHSNDADPSLAVTDPDAYDAVVEASYVEAVAEGLAGLLPGLVDDIGLREGWAGLYPNSPDGRFIVGPASEDPKVIHASGSGGVGLHTAPMVGQIAAEWALFGESRTIPAASSYLLTPERAAAMATGGANR